MLILIRNVANCAKRCYGEGSRQVMEKKENGKNYSKKAMDLGNTRRKHYISVVNKTWHTYLTRQDVSERRERVVQRLVVDTLVQILDEHIAHTRLAQ